LGDWAVPFTLVAVVGLINALNMIDGIDGLAGGVTWIALGGLLLFLPPGSMLFLLLLGTLAALVPYLVVNLELVRCRCKVFLGDAGSLLLGYLIVWGLIEAGRSPADLAPVTALWLVALPLMDTLAVMGRRLSNGRHPFSADRGHLHHCLARLLHSTRRALIILLALALLLAGIGVAGQVFFLFGPSSSACAGGPPAPTALRAINRLAMSDPDDFDTQHTRVHGIDDSVVASADTPEALRAMELSASVGIRVFRQCFDRREHARNRTAMQSSQLLLCRSFPTNAIGGHRA
jgi:hypothetical protein